MKHYCLVSLLSCSLQAIHIHMLAMAMKHTSFLQFLLLFLTTLVSCDDQFLFSGFTQSSLDLDGCAIVTNNGLLDLANGTAILNGHAFYPTPLHFRKSPGGSVQSFSINIVFSIFISYPGLSADGMAFFIAPTKNFSDARAGKYFGLLNEKNNGDTSKHIFMVELDTYRNAELQDINDNHVGININSAISLQSNTSGYYEDGGAFRNLTLNGNKETQLWVDYDEGTTQINVTLAPINVGKPSRPLLSATYDLSTLLSNSTSYIGLSSTASSLNSRQYVMGWSFGLNKPAPPLEVSKLPKLPFLGPKPQSKLLTIVLPIATATLILSIGTVLILVVRRKMKYAEVRDDWEREFGPHRFSYKDLYHAMGGFKNKHLLGEGGFGKVYKGVLPLSNVEVAVKRMSHESRQGCLMLNDRLNTRNILRRRKKFLEEGYNCVTCQDGVEETMEHLFFNCPSAVCRWFKLGITWEENANIHQKVIFARQRFRQPFFMEVFLIGAWCIWKERNDYVFNNLVPRVARWKDTFKAEVHNHLFRIKQCLHPSIKLWLDSL